MKQWKTDNYKFVGKSFDIAYANRLNLLKKVVGETTGNSVDYELTGSEGFGELPKYDGTTLKVVSPKRGFKTIITPEEYAIARDITMKDAKIDKSGNCAKTGTRLGYSAAMTVYLHVLRMFANAYTGANGGDGKKWAATDHPVASKSSSGRTFVADPDSGTYSNLMTKALSVSAISEARTATKRFVTPDGSPFLCNMDMLLVSPELEETARKICGVDGKNRPTKDPDSAENAANPVYDLDYLVIGGGNDGFTAKQWAVCDSQLMREIVEIVYITKPEVIQSELDNPLIDRYTAYVDFACGWGDARQIIFSNPA